MTCTWSTLHIGEECINLLVIIIITSKGLVFWSVDMLINIAIFNIAALAPPSTLFRDLLVIGTINIDAISVMTIAIIIIITIIVSVIIIIIIAMFLVIACLFLFFPFPDYIRFSNSKKW